MSRDRSHGGQKLQLSAQEKGRDKEQEERHKCVMVQGVVYEHLTFRTLLSSRLRFASTLGLKSADAVDGQRPPSPSKVRSPKERHDQGHHHEGNRGVKRRASAPTLAAPSRPAISRRTSSKGHAEHVEDAEAITPALDMKRSATPEQPSPRRRRRKDSVTSSQPVSPKIKGRDSPPNSLSSPVKSSFTHRRPSQGQGPAKPVLKSTHSKTLAEEPNIATPAKLGDDPSPKPRDNPTSGPILASTPEQAVLEAEAEPPAKAEPLAEADVAPPTKPEQAEEPDPEPQPQPSPKAHAPPKSAPKASNPPTRRPTSPKPERLALLGALANFIPQALPKPAPPSPPASPPSPPPPPTVTSPAPHRCRPKNATLVKFGDTTVYTVSVHPDSRHLHRIGPRQFKTRSGLSYLAEPASAGASNSNGGKKRKSCNRVGIIEFPTTGWKTAAGGGAGKLRRHRERQAAMARYWRRTEEEELAEREEAVRRAEGIVRRYAEEEEAAAKPATPVMPAMSGGREGGVERRSGGGVGVGVDNSAGQGRSQDLRPSASPTVGLGLGSTAGVLGGEKLVATRVEEVLDTEDVVDSDIPVQDEDAAKEADGVLKAEGCVLRGAPAPTPIPIPTEETGTSSEEASKRTAGVNWDGEIKGMGLYAQGLE